MNKVVLDPHAEQVVNNVVTACSCSRDNDNRELKGLIPRALFLGEMRNISPVSFELRLLE
jgi:hypothetical protein